MRKKKKVSRRSLKRFVARYQVFCQTCRGHSPPGTWVLWEPGGNGFAGRTFHVGCGWSPPRRRPYFVDLDAEYDDSCGNDDLDFYDDWIPLG